MSDLCTCNREDCSRCRNQRLGRKLEYEKTKLHNEILEIDRRIELFRREIDLLQVQKDGANRALLEVSAKINALP